MESIIKRYKIWKWKLISDWWIALPILAIYITGYFISSFWNLLSIVIILSAIFVFIGDFKKWKKEGKKKGYMR